MQMLHGIQALANGSNPVGGKQSNGKGGGQPPTFTWSPPTALAGGGSGASFGPVLNPLAPAGSSPYGASSSGASEDTEVPPGLG